MNDKLIKLIIQLQDDASAGIAKMNGTIQTMVGTFAGGALLGAVNAAKDAIVGLGASTVTVASDFESGMARFASVAGGSLAQAGLSLDDVKAKALELGR